MMIATTKSTWVTERKRLNSRELPLCPRLVKIFERPAGQQFAAFQRLLESGIAVGYVFQFSGRSRDGLEDHAELVWSKYSNAQRVSSLQLSNGCLNPASRSDTYSSSAEGVAMNWKTMLSSSCPKTQANSRSACRDVSDDDCLQARPPTDPFHYRRGQAHRPLKGSVTSSRK